MDRPTRAAEFKGELKVAVAREGDGQYELPVAASFLKFDAKDSLEYSPATG